MDKDCSNCVFVGKAEHVPTAKICDYPVPAWIKIHSGGGFLYGTEAKTCATYKSKLDLVKEAKTQQNKEAK
jgi:hypothetical protein